MLICAQGGGVLGEDATRTYLFAEIREHGSAFKFKLQSVDTLILA